jgi:hypothetical protein
LLILFFLGFSLPPLFLSGNATSSFFYTFGLTANQADFGGGSETSGNSFRGIASSPAGSLSLAPMPFFARPDPFFFSLPGFVHLAMTSGVASGNRLTAFFGPYQTQTQASSTGFIVRLNADGSVLLNVLVLSLLSLL